MILIKVTKQKRKMNYSKPHSRATGTFKCPTCLHYFDTHTLPYMITINYQE